MSNLDTLQDILCELKEHNEIQHRKFCPKKYIVISFSYTFFSSDSSIIFQSGALFAVLSYVAIHQPDLRLAIVFLPFFTFSAGSVSKYLNLKPNKSLYFATSFTAIVCVVMQLFFPQIEMWQGNPNL